MINRVVLVGRLTKDPEIRYTAQNVPVVSFTIAVSRPFVNQQTGDREADFIPVVIWRKQAENVSKYVKKGHMVAIEGRIQTRDYVDTATNARRYITEVVCDSVVFLESKNSSDSYKPFDNGSSIEPTETKPIQDIEDDLPF